MLTFIGGCKDQNLAEMADDKFEHEVSNILADIAKITGGNDVQFESFYTLFTSLNCTSKSKEVL